MATSLSNAPTLEWVGDPQVGPYIVTYPEGTSETFKKGDLVIFDRSEDGLVVVAQGDGGVYGDSDNNEVADDTNFLGIALADASGTAQTEIAVLIPRPDDVFSAAICLTDNTTLTAPVVDDIGTTVDLIKFDSNNGSKTGVLRGTSGITAVIVDINPQDRMLRGQGLGTAEPTYSAGDRVLFRFLPSALGQAGSQA